INLNNHDDIPGGLDVKAPWYIDLLNINLNNHDLELAKQRIRQYMEAFKQEGVRITENLDTLPA
ncbi:MAG: hypothetical protein PVJ25_07640, partial [Desulfuromonadales bacterium]